MSLQKNVESYNTWFDRTRLGWKNTGNGDSFDKILSKFRRNCRMAAIGQAYHSYCYHSKSNPLGVHWEKLLDDPLLAERANEFLPFPIAKVEEQDLYMSIAAQVAANAEAFKQMDGAPVESVDRAPGKFALLEALDNAVTYYTGSLPIQPGVELMVIEGDLAEKVIQSSNTLMTVEDFSHLPFRKMVLEFSRPVLLGEFEGKKLKALAVAFVAEPASGHYMVTWYTEQTWQLLGPLRLHGNISEFFAGDFHRSIMDDAVRPACGLVYEDFNLELRYGVGVIYKGDEDNKKGYQEYDRTFKAWREIILQASRNIWDFVTSRNIDYVRQQRGAPPYNKIKKYQHLQGKMHDGPRFYKLLKVNRIEKQVEPGQPTGRGTAPGFLEHVPGCFHKWVYCLSCDRVHRHDLIGSPCRRCKAVVGPISNIRIEKWWHTDYWRGEGVQKQTVRELQI